MASKHVSHLEKQVCAKLLQRNSRSLHLTEAGEQYHRCCVQALETLDTAAERAAGGADTPQGRLKITMPMWFANPVFSGRLAEYRRRHPQVSLDLILDNRKADLVAEGIDLALRVSTDDLPPSLIVRPHAVSDGNDEGEPAFGYTFRRRGMPLIDRYDGVGSKVEYARYTDIRKAAVVGSACGYLFEKAVA